MPSDEHLTLDWDLTGVVPVRHPLGFICFPVERDGPRGVCLHLWSPELPRARNTTSGIHCHSWDLTSHVLHGQVRNLIVEIEETAERPTHRVFEVRSGPDGDHLEPTDRTVRHHPGASELFHAGDAYTMPAGRFHRSVIPADGEALTLAYGQGRPGSRDLSLGPLDAPRHQVVRRTLTAGETAFAVRLIEERLRGSGRGQATGR